MKTFVVVTAVLVVVIAGAVMMLSGQSQTGVWVSPAGTPLTSTAPRVVATPGLEEEVVGVPEDWLEYMDNTYGFEFAYPPEYEVLTDEEDLYGWENGVALLYGGGQAYDLAVQVWESEEELNSSFETSAYEPQTVEVGGRLFTLTNLNDNEELEAVADTFAAVE